MQAGITIYGVPMGSVGYIKIVLADKCARIAGIATKLINTLGRVHKQLLWLITKFSTSTKLDYWLRHCYPEDVGEAAGLFDDILRELTAVALGCNPGDDPVAAERVRLPERKGGLGVRRAVDVAAPAFLAGAVSALSVFLDRFEDVDGTTVLVERGALERPAMVARLGRGAFATMATAPGPSGGWHQFFRSGSRLGAAMQGYWGELRARAGAGHRAGDDEGLGVLLRPAHAMWPETDAGLQADVLKVVEDHLYDQLHERVVRGPACRARTVLVTATRETMIWVRALVMGRRAIPVQEWVEIAARSLGLRSPVFGPLVGLPCGLAAHGRVVDPYGDSPCAAIGLEGGHFARLQHDPLCDGLAEIMRAAGTPALREDAAAFAGVPMAHAEVLRRLFAGGGERRRYPTPDITADLPRAGEGARAVPTMVEVKTLHYGPSGYKDSDVLPRAAVDRRAAAVPAERRRDLAKLDRELFGTAEGARGPFEARLDAYPGGVLGVVSGSFGEWSSSLVDLLGGLAEQGAARWMGRLAAPSLAQARSTLLRLWRTRLGMCVLRGHAKLMVARAQQLYLRQAQRGGAGWARQEATAPVGAGPEIGESEFARAADGAYWRCRAEPGARPGRGGARGASRAGSARGPRARA
jgi:hypothetical protein